MPEHGAWSGPAARLFALCAAVLAAKLLLLVAYAALVARRERRARQLAPDDAAPEASSALARRIAATRREDLELFALFCALGLLFLRWGSAGATLAQAVFAAFAVASIFHGWCAVAGLPRGRALNLAVAWLCLLLLASFVVVGVLRAG